MSHLDQYACPAPAGAIEIRAGLSLRWGPVSPAIPTEPDTVYLSCHLDPQPGRMVLRRAPGACPCAASFGSFAVVIQLSASAIAELLADDPSAGAAALRHFTGCGTQVPAPGFEHPLSARARLSVESIRRCPFAGVCRTMALTARCHDLLVEFLTAWTEVLVPMSATASGPAEGARLAAEILERDLEHPPALSQLATRIGLSETTLKRAFPRVFGTTVFGYLRRRRMEEARRLIESGTATVLEAATQVGYSNPSNFATAFRREFGVNPKTHQLATRR